MDLFRKQGFESTTADQIAEEADVSKGTLYNYFPSKEAILQGYVQQGAAEANPYAGLDRVAA
jgi:AcrR family transcriptional regulator